MSITLSCGANAKHQIQNTSKIGRYGERKCLCLVKKLLKCIVCAREGSDTTMKYLLTLKPNENLWVCSEECYLEFGKRIVEGVTSEMIGTSSDNISYAFWVAMRHALGELSPEIGERFRKMSEIELWSAIELRSADNKYESDIIEDFTMRFHESASILLASNLEAAGRPLDAAEVYESLHMYDKARALREKEKRIVVREVSVDLNSLLQQVKDGGIVAVYRCPHCGGKLKIDKETSAESLRTCEHCGLEIEVMELADFLKTALS